MSQQGYQFKQTYGEPFWMNCRLTYCCLDKPDTGHRNSRNKYCVHMLVSKQDTAAMQDALQRLCFVGGVANFNELLKHPFMDEAGNWRDGDAPEYAKREGWQGCWVCIVGSKDPVDCYALDANSEPVLLDQHQIASTIYNGCYGSVYVTPAMYDNTQGGPETTLYMNAVIKTEDGPRLKGGRIDPIMAYRNWAPAPATQGQIMIQAPQMQAAPQMPQVPMPQQTQGFAQTLAPQQAPAPQMQQQMQAAPQFAPQAPQQAPQTAQEQPQVGEQPQRRQRRTKAQMQEAGSGSVPQQTAQGPQFGGTPTGSTGTAGAPQFGGEQTVNAAPVTQQPMTGTAGAAPQFGTVPNGRGQMSNLLND